MTNIRGLDEEQAWDYENGFHWFSSPSRLNKMLAHYELYKMIKDLPGDIVELGVYKSASLIRFATFRNTFENDAARRIVGFDAFGAFPTDGLSLPEDLEFVEEFEEEAGDGLSREEIEKILEIKGFSNIELVKGNVLDTLPRYLSRYPHTRIALLHLDMDVKEPTAFALERLFERVVRGGLIVVDDYNAVAGATDAIDEFAARHDLRLHKMPHYNVPAYIVKQ